MNIKSLVLYFFISISLLTSCDKSHKDGSNVQVAGNDGLTRSRNNSDQNDPNRGGLDSGGGNGINGKMLESFKVDLLTGVDQSLVDNLLDLIKKLMNIYPEFAGNMFYVLSEKDWYLIPISLKKLPSIDIGLLSESDSYDQIALQNTKSIWIDETIFTPMSSPDKLITFIHELVMGVRLLEFSATQDQCLAGLGILKYYWLIEKNEEAGANFTKIKKQKCLNRSNLIKSEFGSIFGSHKKIRLNSSDYDVIRKLTSKIVNNIDKLDREDIEFYFESYTKQTSE